MQKRYHPFGHLMIRKFRKLNILWPRGHAIKFLGICLKELKAGVHTQALTQMFIAA